MNENTLACAISIFHNRNVYSLRFWFHGRFRKRQRYFTSKRERTFSPAPTLKGSFCSSDRDISYDLLDLGCPFNIDFALPIAAHAKGTKHPSTNINTTEKGRYGMCFIHRLSTCKMVYHIFMLKKKWPIVFNIGTDIHQKLTFHTKTHVS